MNSVIENRKLRILLKPIPLRLPILSISTVVFLELGGHKGVLPFYVPGMVIRRYASNLEQILPLFCIDYVPNAMIRITN